MQYSAKNIIAIFPSKKPSAKADGQAVVQSVGLLTGISRWIVFSTSLY